MLDRQQTREAAVGLALHAALVVLFATLVMTQPLDLNFFSQSIGFTHPLTSDPLGGAVRVVAILALLGFALLPARDAARRRTRLQAAAVGLFVAIYLVLPAVQDMAARRRLGLVRTGGPVASRAHDGGVLQTEAALDFMFSGVSPYGASYRDTQMSRGGDSNPMTWLRMGFTSNPAYEFLPYPPFTLLVSAPFYLVGKHLVGGYDQRVVYLAALAALCLLCYRLPRRPSWRAALVGLVVLNLYFGHVHFYAHGRNDVLCITFVVGVLFALDRRRELLAAVLLALACGTKQYAWPLAPLVFAYLAGRHRSEASAGGWRGRLLRPLAGFALTSAVIWLPFVIWDARGLFHGVLSAQRHNYPHRLRGMGVADLLIALSLISSYRDPFDLTMLATVLAPVLCGVGCVQLYRGATLSRMLAWFTGCLFCILFLGRFFAQNQFAIIFVAIVGLLYFRAEEVLGQGRDQ